MTADDLTRIALTGSAGRTAGAGQQRLAAVEAEGCAHDHHL